MYYRKNALQKNIFDFYILTEYFIRVWSTFSKVVGVGKAHKYFPFMQSNDSQTAWLFAPDKLLYRKIFMGAAQTRNF